jgi:energy-coupling factor transporter ATP-binding protein EcfA2
LTRLEWETCERCGALGLEAAPEDDAVTLRCATCGFEGVRRRMPFFSITGASGSGKTTLTRRLWRVLPECIALDGDLLWHPIFWSDRSFHHRWLAVAAQASQSGRPVVVCTAAMPDAWELDVAVLVGPIHMLAIVCDDGDLVRRLEARERPRDPSAPSDFVEQTRTFNRWLRAHVEFVDSSVNDADRLADLVADWIRARL